MNLNFCVNMVGFCRDSHIYIGYLYFKPTLKVTTLPWLLGIHEYLWDHFNVIIKVVSVYPTNFSTPIIGSLCYNIM